MTTLAGSSTYDYRPRMDKTADAGTQSRGTFLTVMTVLFVVLAFSDFTKPLQYINDALNQEPPQLR